MQSARRADRPSWLQNRDGWAAAAARTTTWKLPTSSRRVRPKLGVGRRGDRRVERDLGLPVAGRSAEHHRRRLFRLGAQRASTPPDRGAARMLAGRDRSYERLHDVRVPARSAGADDVVDVDERDRPELAPIRSRTSSSASSTPAHRRQPTCASPTRDRRARRRARSASAGSPSVQTCTAQPRSSAEV
jgi:hypothetical protein